MPSRSLITTSRRPKRDKGEWSPDRRCAMRPMKKRLYSFLPGLESIQIKPVPGYTESAPRHFPCPKRIVSCRPFRAAEPRTAILQSIAYYCLRPITAAPDEISASKHFRAAHTMADGRGFGHAILDRMPLSSQYLCPKRSRMSIRFVSNAVLCRNSSAAFWLSHSTPNRLYSMKKLSLMLSSLSTLIGRRILS